MNDLLFYALLIALLYYFFFYLPSQKKLNTTNPPGKQHQATQTNPILENSPELAELKTKNQALATELKTNQKKITELQSQIRDLAKRPVQPTNSKSVQTDTEADLTNTLDTLIKGIQELNNSLN